MDNLLVIFRAELARFGKRLSWLSRIIRGKTILEQEISSVD